MSLLTGLAEFWSFNDSLVGLNGTAWTANGGLAYSPGLIEKCWRTDKTAANALSCSTPWSPYNAVGYSVSLWFKMESDAVLNEFGTVLRLEESESLKWRLQIRKGFISPNIQMVVTHYRGPEDPVSTSATKTGFDSNWHHFVFTYDAVTQDAELYLDNSDVGGASLLIRDSEAVPDNLYHHDGSFGTLFDGSIENLGLWERALSVFEVSELFNLGLSTEVPTSRNSGNSRRNISGKHSRLHSRG